MIDIIIVTYNAKDKLRLCLKSIERHTKEKRYLITVVDNNSCDGTLKFLKGYKLPLYAIHSDKNLGFCGGANLGLKRTKNKFVALLDDDIEVTKGWLNCLYNQIKNNRSIGIVGPKIIFPDKRINSAGCRALPLDVVGNCEIDKGQRDYIKECDALIGPCWLMRREIIKDAGYFDERFFPSQHEDIDYCLMTRLAGYKIIYNGEVEIIHHHLSRDGGRFRKNRDKFLRKWKHRLHKFPLKDSHPADKYVARGFDCLKSRRFIQALSEFRKAELLDERFSEPLYKGFALIGLKKFDETIAEFKTCLKANPYNFRARYYLASTYREIGRIKEARKEYLNSIQYLSKSQFDAL